MKIQSIALAIITSFVATPSVLADTSVSNTWSTRTESGHGTIRTNIVREVRGTQMNDSQSIKMEADKGDINSANIRFDGRTFSGNAASSNGRPIDPVVYGGFVRQTENLGISETSTTQIREGYNFGSNVFTHTVGTESR